MRRPTRLAIVVVLIAGWPCALQPSTAAAVTPPSVDDSFLPQAAKPRPPQATEQLEKCGAPTIDPAHDIAAPSPQLKALDLEAVRPLSRGQGQVVAVIDTGVSRHRLLPALKPGGDYVAPGDGTQDCDGHGTLVAGIIAGAPDAVAAFSGVAPDASVITIRQSSNKFGPVHNHDRQGFGDVDTLAMAVRTAADMGASVINVSLVACVPGGTVLDDRALGAALAYAVDRKDAVVVAAAGNVESTGECPQQNPADTGWDTVSVAVSPGWYDDYVLTVGSTKTDGSPSTFSLAGPWVDVATPGEGVVSLSPTGDGLVNAYAVADGSLMPISGTSFAAPVVSGVVALVRARFPRFTARDVMRRIEATARRPAAGSDPFVGNGTVDALAAVSDDPPVPRQPTPQDASRPVPLQDSPKPPDSQGPTVVFAGAGACAAILAAAVALGAPANRLARRRRDRDGRDPVVGD